MSIFDKLSTENLVLRELSSAHNPVSNIVFHEEYSIQFKIDGIMQWDSQAYVFSDDHNLIF